MTCHNKKKNKETKNQEDNNQEVNNDWYKDGNIPLVILLFILGFVMILTFLYDLLF